MTVSDLRLLIPAVAAWVGAFVGTGWPGWWPAAAAVVALTCSFLCWRSGSLVAAGAMLCLFAGVAMGGARALGLHSGPVDGLAEDRATVTGTVVLTGDPQRHQSGTRGGARRDLYSVPARLERVVGRGHAARVRAPVLLFASDAGWADLLPGQRTAASGRLGPALPGQPIAAVFSVRGPPRPDGRPSRVQLAAGDLRAGLRRSVDGLPAGPRGLVPGLVVGDTSRLPAEIEEQFRVAGLTHLTAVSGANIA